VSHAFGGPWWGISHNVRGWTHAGPIQIIFTVINIYITVLKICSCHSNNLKTEQVVHNLLNNVREFWMSSHCENDHI